jgi:hypothetical protein
MPLKTKKKSSSQVLVKYVPPKTKNGSHQTMVPVQMIEPALKSGKPVLGAKKKQNSKGKKGLPQFAIAHVDAFCEEAFGVKVPDDSTFPSATAFTKTETTLSASTTTTTSVASAFYVDPRTYWTYSGTPSAGAWTWAASYGSYAANPNLSAILNNFSLIRPVACSFRITTPASYTNAQGYVHLAMVADLRDGTTWNFPTSLAAMLVSPYYQRIPIADLIQNTCVINSYYSDQSAFRYLDPNEGNGPVYNVTLPSTGWGALVVYCDGLTAVSGAPAVSVEQIVHWECIVPGGAVPGIVMETKAAPNSPAVLAATQYLVEEMSPIRVVEDAVNQASGVWNTIESIFKTGIDIANGVASTFSLLSPLLMML